MQKMHYTIIKNVETLTLISETIVARKIVTLNAPTFNHRHTACTYDGK